MNDTSSAPAAEKPFTKTEAKTAGQEKAAIETTLESKASQKISKKAPPSLDQVQATAEPQPKPTAVRLIKPIDAQAGPEKKSATPKKRNWLPKWLRWLLVIILVIILLIVIVGGIVVANVYPLAQKGITTVQRVNTQVEQLKQSAKQKNLSAIDSQLTELQGALNELQDIRTQLAWAGNLPYIKDYYSDSGHIIKGAYAITEAGQLAVVTITPYSDLLGLVTDQAIASDSAEPADGTTPETAQDRVEFIVNTIDKLLPGFDDISAKLAEANNEISHIDPNRYPEEINGLPVRSQIKNIVNIINQATVLIVDAKPLLEVAPHIVGNDAPRKYLILFQNDAELRPTGGFLTAYALLQVDKGDITPLSSSDIYDLDAKYSGKLEAPQPLIDFIPDPYNKESVSGITPQWRIRDMNLSPDFKQFAETFLPEYLKTNSPEVDAVIAIDTQVLLKILEVIGPVGVSGYGNYSAELDDRCNCPQVILALESIISVETPYFRENRKAVLGPLMHSILANAKGQPKEKMAELVEVGLEAIKQKHVVMYFRDENVQQALEAFNLAGRIKQADAGTDYLALVDTNFAGAKSNLYIEQEIDLVVEAGPEYSTNKLTLTYRNPQEHDGWLNGDYPDWFRLYVPAGSELVASNGSEIDVTTTEELGKTVFAGFFVLRPQGIAKVTLEYRTPIQATDQYKLLLQKQGGTKNHQFKLNVNGQGQEFKLDGDREIMLNI
jgi:hypothetical protein